MKKGKNLAQALVCAISIETTKTTIAICDHKGDLALDSQGNPCYKELKTHKNLKPQLFLHDICQDVLGLFQKLPEKCREKLSYICVGVPGKSGTEWDISTCTNGIWDQDVPIKDIMTDELHVNVPIIVINSTAALAKAAVHLSSELL